MKFALLLNFLNRPWDCPDLSGIAVARGEASWVCYKPRQSKRKWRDRRTYKADAVPRLHIFEVFYVQRFQELEHLEGMITRGHLNAKAFNCFKALRMVDRRIRSTHDNKYSVFTAIQCQVGSEVAAWTNTSKEKLSQCKLSHDFTYHCKVSHNQPQKGNAPDNMTTNGKWPHQRHLTLRTIRVWKASSPFDLHQKEDRIKLDGSKTARHPNSITDLRFPAKQLRKKVWRAMSLCTGSSHATKLLS